jgi:hypothetical protein
MNLRSTVIRLDHPCTHPEIASNGGKAARTQGRAREFTAEEARAAARKGCEVGSFDRAHMSAMGRTGDQARGRSRAAQRRETESTEEPAGEAG